MLTEVISQSKEEIDLTNMPTEGEGDCSFHAAFGEWDENLNKFICKNILNQRKKIADAVRQCQRDSSIWPSVLEGIQQLVIAEKGGKEIANLKNLYEKFLIDDQIVMAQIWEEFERALTQCSEITDYVQETLDKLSLEEKKGLDTFQRQFSKCLTLNEGLLYGLIMSFEELNNQFKEYNEKTNKAFDLNKYITQNVLDEYADIVQRKGNWLLPGELAILAHASNRTIELYMDDKKTNARKLIESYNPGKNLVVQVYFNGANHYERLLNNKEHAKLVERRRDAWALAGASAGQLIPESLNTYLMSHLLQAGFRGSEYQFSVLMLKMTEMLLSPNIIFEAEFESFGKGNLDDVVISVKNNAAMRNTLEAYQIKYYKDNIVFDDFYNEKADSTKTEKMHIGKFYEGWLAHKRSRPELKDKDVSCVLYTNTGLDPLLSKAIDGDKFSKGFINGQQKLYISRSSKISNQIAKNFLTKESKRISASLSTKVWEELQKQGILDIDGNMVEQYFQSKAILDSTLKRNDICKAYLPNISNALYKKYEIYKTNQVDAFELLYSEALEYLRKQNKYDSLLAKSDSEKKIAFTNFLKSFVFKIHQPDIEATEAKIKKNLVQYLNDSPHQVFLCMYFAMREWFRREQLDKKVPKLTTGCMKELLTKAKVEYRDSLSLYGRSLGALALISCSSNGKTVPRKELQELRDLIKNKNEKTILLVGEKGVGKSGLIKCALTEFVSFHPEEYLFIPAIDLVNDPILQKDLIAVLKINKFIKVLAIDSAENLLSLEKEKYNKFMDELRETEKTIVLTFPADVFSRNVHRIQGYPMQLGRLLQMDVQNFFPELYNRAELIPLLDVACIPFYLNIITSYLVKVDMKWNASQEDFKRYLIKLSIEQGSDYKFNEIKHRLLKIMAASNLRTNKVAYQPSATFLEAAKALARNGVLIGLEQNHYAFSHTLYYEWSLEERITQEFDNTVHEKGDWESFLKFGSIYYLKEWARGRAVDIITCLHQYELNVGSLKILLILINSFIELDLINADKIKIGAVLSSLWEKFPDEQKTLVEELTRLLLKFPEGISSKITTVIRMAHNANVASDFPSLTYKQMVLFKLILSSVETNDVFCASYPEMAMNLINKICIATHRRESLYGESGVEADFRLKKYNVANVEFRPASAYQGPFYPILKHHGVQHLSHMLELINKSCNSYIETRHKVDIPKDNTLFHCIMDENIVEVDLTTPQGQIKKLYGNAYLWGLYRNSGVNKPGLTQSALMAIERWLLELVVVDHVVLLKALDLIIDKSTTVATVSLIASVCLTGNKKLIEYAYTLFKTMEFYHWDSRRRFEDRHLLHYYTILDNDLFIKERHEADSLPHRALDLSELTLLIQNDNEEGQNQITTILDKHYLDLQSEFDDEKRKDGKLKLWNIDIRKRRKEERANGIALILDSYDEELETYLTKNEKPWNEMWYAENIYKLGLSLYNSNTLFEPKEIGELIEHLKIPKPSEKHVEKVLIAGQCYISCFLLLSHYAILKDDYKSICLEMLFKVINKDDENYAGGALRNSILGSYDGEVVISQAMPHLLSKISDRDPNYQNIKKIIIVMLTHHYFDVISSTAKSIKNYLWDKCPDFVESCMKALVEFYNIIEQHERNFGANNGFNYDHALLSLRDKFYKGEISSQIPEYFGPNVIKPINKNIGRGVLSSGQSHPFNISKNPNEPGASFQNIIYAMQLMASGNLKNAVSEQTFMAYLKTIQYYPLEYIIANNLSYEILILTGKHLLNKSDIEVYLDEIIFTNNNVLIKTLKSILYCALRAHSNKNVENIEEIKLFWRVWLYMLKNTLEKGVGIPALLDYGCRLLGDQAPDKLSQLILDSRVMIRNFHFFRKWLYLACNIEASHLSEILCFIIKKMPEFVGAHYRTEQNYQLNQGDCSIEEFLDNLFNCDLLNIVSNEILSEQVDTIFEKIRANESIDNLRKKYLETKHSILLNKIKKPASIVLNLAPESKKRKKGAPGDGESTTIDSQPHIILGGARVPIIAASSLSNLMAPAQSILSSEITSGAKLGSDEGPLPPGLDDEEMKSVQVGNPTGAVVSQVSLENRLNKLNKGLSENYCREQPPVNCVTLLLSAPNASSTTFLNNGKSNEDSESDPKAKKARVNPTEKAH